MALQTYTLEQLTTAAQHALGKTAATRVDLTQSINDALTRFCSMRLWGWLISPLSLDLVADQNYVLLPADFAQLRNIGLTGTLGYLQAATHHQIVEWRTWTPTVPVPCYRYAVSWRTQANRLSPPRAQLELYPTPSAASSAALTGFYQRIVDVLKDEQDIPDIPPQYHTILKAFVRAHVLEEDGRPEADAERARVDRLIVAQIEQDGMVQPNLGPMVGAVLPPPHRISTSIGPGETITPP